MKNNKKNRSNRYIFLLIILILVLFFGHRKTSPTNEICYKTNCFHIQIAKDEKSREKWLMFLPSLAPESWMLFIFPQEWIYDFRMKNTLIPLDMIRLDWNLKVVGIVEALPCKSDPCKLYSSVKKSKYVLEINKWISSKIWLKIGDTFKLKE